MRLFKDFTFCLKFVQRNHTNMAELTLKISAEIAGVGLKLTQYSPMANAGKNVKKKKKNRLHRLMAIVVALACYIGVKPQVSNYWLPSRVHRALFRG